jgi:sulfate adenylyltransferase subunit 1
MEILRFITAGNVDDGKSTLIGRLLYDTKNIKADILESISDAETESINLAHLTDGLRAERQRGITIDVAYKYFSTNNRKYILTDAPGHFQYTKNLVTGTSGVDVMIILIDALNGITDQTRRHSLVASFLGIKHVVVAINKMDSVGYNEQVFSVIKDEYATIVAGLQIFELMFIPISALVGDNVSSASANMPWYTGTTLLAYLEYCKPVGIVSNSVRFVVQCSVHTDKEGFENGYAGKLLSGAINVGNKVIIYPNKQEATIARILHGYNEVRNGIAGQNLCLYFTGAVEAGRGSLITHLDNTPQFTNRFEAMVCWLDDEKTLQVDMHYLLRINTFSVGCVIESVLYKTEINTFAQVAATTVSVNEFARITVVTDMPVAQDSFLSISKNGRGIIIDTATNNTVAAFTIC